MTVAQQRPKDAARPKLTAGALTLLLVGEFMIQLDTTIVNVALPPINEELGFGSSADLQWVINAYVLLYGGLLLLGGRAGDLFGRRRLLIVGVAVFTVASLLCGLAQDPTTLVLARALQGVGAAATAPAVLSLITSSTTEGPERNRALGAWGAVAGAGAVLGLLLGGALATGPGWRWVFLINLVPGAVIIALAHRLLPDTRAPHRPRLDVAGAALGTGGLLTLVYALVRTAEHGWDDPATLGLFMGAAALLAIFVAVEGRRSDPLVRLGLLRRRVTATTLVATLLFASTQFGLFFFLSLYLQQVLGFSPLEAGFAYLPLALAYGAASGGAQQLATRHGLRAALAPGLILIGTGQLWLLTLEADGTYPVHVLGPMILSGIGLGLSYVPLSISATSGVSAGEQGLASGLFNSSLQIGGALGLALLTTFATTATSDALAGGAGQAQALVDGFHAAYLVGAVLAFVALVSTLVLLPRSTTPVTATTSE